MSSLRKKALIRLLLCAIVLIATIVFSFLLLTGTFDGSTDSTSTPESSSVSDGEPASEDAVAEDGTTA